MLHILTTKDYCLCLKIELSDYGTCSRLWRRRSLNFSLRPKIKQQLGLLRQSPTVKNLISTQPDMKMDKSTYGMTKLTPFFIKCTITMALSVNFNTIRQESYIQAAKMEF